MTEHAATLAQDAGVPRSVRELRPADFAASPIWTWCVDDEVHADADESFVRPVLAPAVPRAAVGQWLVAATAILKDGREMPACVEVTSIQGRVRFHPLFVFLLERQLEFVSNETDRLLGRYTKHPANRPVKWRLEVLMEGERRLRQGRVKRSLLSLLVTLALSRAMRR